MSTELQDLKAPINQENEEGQIPAETVSQRESATDADDPK